MGNIDIIVAVGFMTLVIFVGLWKSKGEETHSEHGAADYFLAGRGLSWWLIGFSLIAANISAEQFVGMSGQGAGLEGLSVSSWEWIAAITLVVVAFVLLPFFLKAGITTIPEFLEVRYNHWARLMMTLSMMLILIGVSLIGVIYAGALTMKELLADFGTNVDLALCCWIMGIMAALYVAVGGLKACAWADLLQGAALIVGGGVIAYFAFKALGAANVSDLVNADGTQAVVAQSAGVMEKFNTLNDAKMHMDSPSMPWGILLLGIWIPNFYYWGLNQYITQRILGSASLAEGQKGLVLAAFMKLIIPFVIVIPGIIAFNLFSPEMKTNAEEDFLKSYQRAVASQTLTKTFECTKEFTAANPEKAAEIAAFNTQVLTKGNREEITTVTASEYKYDSALGLLIGKLLPKNKGVLGFVIAALLGAIVSSLAAVLNAASTLFTMDVYGRYLKKDATPFQLVSVGRICIGFFVVIGCLAAPALTKFESVFGFIQSFQGYVSTGILAVFIYGLINRSSGKWAGVIGLVANPIIYGILEAVRPEGKGHYLYSMSYSLLIVLAILFVYGFVQKAEKEVVFESNTTMDLSSSKGALIAGVIVSIMTVMLYVIFW